MLIGAFLLGALLSVAVCALLWGTGRRPYLRVDVERHESRELVHVLHQAPAPTPAVVHRVADPIDPAIRPARRELNTTPTPVAPATLPAAHVTPAPRKDTYR